MASISNGGSDADKSSSSQGGSSPVRIGSPRRRSPPASLPDYAKSKKHFSVTDLTSPLWCEYALQYGILGMHHLPVSQRPKEIATSTGHILRPDTNLAVKREKILVKGRKVHKKLEKEVHPVKVQVETTTKEDVWGLRILRMLSGLQTLLDSGCCRELPIFGMIQGKVIIGVIDEISRRPLSKRLNRYLDEKHIDERSKVSLSSFFSMTDSDLKAEAEDADSSKAAGTKRWASQEEWRKAKRKHDTSAKLDRMTPTKATRRAPKAVSVAANQSNLTSFFGGGSVQPKFVAGLHTAVDKAPERYGYFLEDSKTRKANLLPPLADQEQARMQCMLYKHLFDGLLVGLCGIESTDGNVPKEAEILAVDAKAKTFEVEKVLSSLRLDMDAPLSQGFSRDAERLIEGLQRTSRSGGSSDDQQISYSLTFLLNLLRGTMLNLASSAREGLGWQAGSDVRSGALQNHLRITYRRRKGKFVRKGSNKNNQKNIQSGKGEVGASSQSIRDINGPSSDEDSTSPISVNSHDGENEDIQLAIALQLGIEAPDEDGQKEDEAMLGNNISLPQTSSRASHRNDGDAEAHEASNGSGQRNTSEDKNVIGTVTFLHDPERLAEHIVDVLKMYNGERELRGVSLEQSGRCHHCEFRHDCEWREAKGKEKLDEFARTLLVRQGADELSAMASKADESKGTSDTMQEVEEKKHAAIKSPRTPSQARMDDEESLWSQFQVIHEEEDFQK